MRKQIGALSCCLLGAICMLGAGTAAQVIYQNPRDLAENAAVIVTGRVAHVQSSWNAKRTKIFTEVALDVEEMYAGDAEWRVTIVQLGGLVGNVKMTVDGVAAWNEGEEVLLFLEPYDSGRYQVSGLSAGRFEIIRDPVTKEAFINVIQEPGAPTTSQKLASGAGNVERDGKMPLRQFISSVVRPAVEERSK